MSTSENSTQQAARRKNQGMNGNLTVGRFGGVELRLNWSLLAVVALIVWSLSDGVFPSQNPGLSHNTYLGMAVVASLLFLASIALHELGHSWVARREGIEVDSITLWLFGGVSQLNGRFKSPGAEFRVAVAGPLVSIVLGVLFVVIAIAGAPSEVDGVAAWLGYINLLLAAFNLLPAAPLDGGRVLHSILWRAKGDFAWATRVASEVGQGFAYLFIALGLAMFIFEGSFSGAWLAFIGWFLLQGARAEARYVATEQALGGLRVRDLMVRHPVTVDADSTIGRFMDDVAVVAQVHHLSRPRRGQAGRPPRLRLGRRGSPLRLGYATRAGHDVPARRRPAAHRGRAGRGRPRRSCPHRRGIVGSWWTTDTWPGCCRSPTSHERSKLAEPRLRHLRPGRHDEHQCHGDDCPEPLKQIEAGVLNVGYVEAGPADGPAVLLLHGWPYDIHSYAEVAPLLAAEGYRVDRPLPARLRDDSLPLGGRVPKRPAGGPRPRRDRAPGRARDRPGDRRRLRLGRSDGQRGRCTLARALRGTRLRERLPDRQPSRQRATVAAGGGASVVVPVLLRYRPRPRRLREVHA